MKFWFEGFMEEGDELRECSVCRNPVKQPERCFVEFEIYQGREPNPQELHPEPSGRAMCARCAALELR